MLSSSRAKKLDAKAGEAAVIPEGADALLSSLVVFAPAGIALFSNSSESSNG